MYHITFKNYGGVTQMAFNYKDFTYNDHLAFLNLLKHAERTDYHIAIEWEDDDKYSKEDW